MAEAAPVVERIAFIDLGAQQRRIRAQVDAAIARVLDHGAYVMGPEIDLLEAALAERGGARHAITCASGTDALVMALMALGVEAGDRVLVPSFTFVASAEAIVLVGATPVFVDVGPDLNVGPEQVRAALAALAADGQDVAGIIAVDLFGRPADHAGIEAVAGDRWVLVDAAQSYGGRRAGSPVGSTGRVTTTSFFPAKPLGCYGDGGAVLTDDDELAAVMRSVRIHGQGIDKYDNVRVGINGRLDTIQAAVLLEKLAIFDDEIARRQAVADRYAKGLPSSVTPPAPLEPGTVSTWAQYTVADIDRDALAGHLGAAGVPTAVYYPRPLHQQTAYRHHPCAGPMTESERAAGQVLSLPMHPYLSVEDQQRVLDAVAAVRS